MRREEGTLPSSRLATGSRLGYFMRRASRLRYCQPRVSGYHRRHGLQAAGEESEVALRGRMCAEICRLYTVALAKGPAICGCDVAASG